MEERIGSWLEVAGVWRSRGCRLVQLGLEEGGQEGKDDMASVLSGAIADGLLVGLQLFSFFPQNFGCVYPIWTNNGIRVWEVKHGGG